MIKEPIEIEQDKPEQIAEEEQIKETSNKVYVVEVE